MAFEDAATDRPDLDGPKGGAVLVRSVIQRSPMTPCQQRVIRCKLLIHLTRVSSSGVNQTLIGVLSRR